MYTTSRFQYIYIYHSNSHAHSRFFRLTECEIIPWLHMSKQLLVFILGSYWMAAFSSLLVVMLLYFFKNILDTVTTTKATKTTSLISVSHSFSTRERQDNIGQARSFCNSFTWTVWKFWTKIRRRKLKNYFFPNSLTNMVKAECLAFSSISLLLGPSFLLG